ncbi:hypothetical protein GF415_02200 [Candidatus Micrarchaeota archaeon]|nr:hypothetical protein [Candidatus Micrarchaeota archaeon]
MNLPMVLPPWAQSQKVIAALEREKYWNISALWGQLKARK